MKKLCIIVICFSLFFTLTAYASSREEADKSKTNIDADVYIYPAQPGTEAWTKLEGHPEKIEISQLPEEWLEKDTVTLLRCVLTYPLLIDVFAWSTFKEGLDNVSSYFNGMEELLKHDDLVLAANTIDFDSIDYQFECQRYNAKEVLELFQQYPASLTATVGIQASSGTKSTEVTNNNVLTPNNTQVPHYENHSWSDLGIDQDDAEMKEWQYYVTYSLTPVYPINILYNCHSYAWHNGSSSNIYWFDNPSYYWNDSSFYQVYSVAFGYRVVYYRSDKPNPYNHSGIVYATGSPIVIESKWGYCGVYRHNLTDCPYYKAGYTTMKYYTRSGE